MRVNDEIEPFLKTGCVFALANKDVKYRVIYAARRADGIWHNGDPDFQLMKVIGVLDSCHKLTYLADKAIIKENSSIISVFRACGAEIAMQNDVSVDKFTCLIGEYPTYGLMRALGRTATLPVWDGKATLTFKRVRDLFNEKPKEILKQDTTQTINSGFLERHETPAYYSNKADGAISKSAASKGRRADFEMFADKQVLNNLATYLVNRKIWTTNLTPNIRAGDVIQVADKPYIVITAVHAMGKAGTGTQSQMSRFWLGDLTENMDRTK